MTTDDLKQIVEDIGYLTRERDAAKLKNIFLSCHPSDIAHILRSFEDEDRDYLFGLIDPETASEVLPEMDDYSRNDILSDLEDERISEIVDEMDSDDATDLVADLPSDVAEHVLEAIDEEDSLEVRELLQHDEDTAGGLMALEIVTAHPEDTLAATVARIREKADEVDDLYNLWVVDRQNRLLGVVSLRDLILAHPEASAGQIMDTNFHSVRPGEDQEEVARIFKRYNLVSAPVVDDHGALVGRITIDDIVDVMEEEASEDIHRMAGVAADEEQAEVSAFKISRARLPWLTVVLVGELMASFVIRHYEDSLQKMIMLAAFIPVVMAMGGATGNQCSATVIRGLATGEIQLRNTLSRLGREIRVALINSLAAGGVLASIIYAGWGKGMVGLLLGGVLVMVILWSAVFGTTAPLILKRAGFDPANASAPLISTLNDVLGVLVYLTIATLLLQSI